MPILRLDENLVNKIAAGEVIERPASVLKELLENSIDAGADRIQIQLEMGGLSLILVKDNGHGIARDEVAVAFERHATSKLTSERDLFRIRTLGFRGEALPSIASVARVTMDTCTDEDEEGTTIEIEGGTVKHILPIARNTGTTIHVRDLFFNTPVRLKYVKSLQTELGHCLDVVQKLSLAHPEIAFHLIHNGKPVLQTMGTGELLHVYRSIYGKDAAKQMLSLQHSHRDHQVKGLIGLPALSRSNRNHCLLFLNGRPIRHYGILSAVIDAYGHRLPIHRFPMFVLQIELDPSLVDVNVHPTKLEVRFSEEEDVRIAVSKAVQQALEASNPVPSFGAAATRIGGVNLFQGQGTNLSTREKSTQVSFSEQAPAVKPSERELPVKMPSLPAERVQETIRELYQPELTIPPQPVEHLSNDHQTQADQEPPKKYLGLKPVAQTLGMYVIAENPDGMYIIDQHAAHERILFERFRRKYKERLVSPLPLLIPITREVTPSEKSSFERFQPQVQSLGFDMESFGESAIVVRAVPDIWSGQSPETLTLEFLDEWFQNPLAASTVLDKLEDRIITKACKAAIKANQWLSMPEMAALCKGLDELEDPFHCPHGRPILLHFTHYELEKQFKRVM